MFCAIRRTLEVSNRWGWMRLETVLSIAPTLYTILFYSRVDVDKRAI